MHNVTLALALAFFTATAASAAPLTLDQVGAIDPLVVGGAATLPNSGDATERNWAASVLSVSADDLAYGKLADSGGSFWQPVGLDSGVFAFEFTGAPGWFILKVGKGGSDTHFLFENAPDLGYGVIDFNELGFDTVDVGKISHVSAVGSGSSDEQNATVPEPASLTLLGLGLAGLGTAVRRRRA